MERFQVSETIDFVPPPVKVLEFPGVQGMKVIVNENDELAFHADRVMETKRWEGYHVWHRIQDALRALMRKANIEWKGQAEGDTDLVCTDQGTMIRMSDVGMSEGDER